MSKKQVLKRMAERNTQLVLTFGSGGASYSLADGSAVGAKIGRELTSEKPSTMQWVQDDLFVAPNEDGLFPGMSQTWSVIQ